MAGRNSKPTQLIKLEGNKDRRTKAELDHREKAERAMKTGTTFKEEPATKADEFAHKEFLRLKKLYKEIDYVEGLDQAIINRYCQLKSQENSLNNLYKKFEQKLNSDLSPFHRLEAFEQIDALMTKQNQVRNMLLKLEDRLLLNPTARVRAVPKKPPEKEKPSPMSNFLEKRRNAGR